MTSRSLKVAWIIMLVASIVVLLFGLIFVLSPQVMNSSGYESYTGNSWDSFVSATPKTADLLLLTSGTMFGMHLLVMGVFFVAVTVTAFRSGQRWSWYTLLIANTLGWGSDTVALLIMGLVPLAISSVAFLLLAYIALGISAKPILSKKSFSFVPKRVLGCARTEAP